MVSSIKKVSRQYQPASLKPHRNHFSLFPLDVGVQKRKQPTPQAAPAEEIIAEDYDVEEPYDFEYQPAKKPQQNYWGERLKRRIVDGSIGGCAGCPNKYNIHHKCSLFCANKYGDGIKEPSGEYSRRKARLLKRYPLPKDWKEIFDNGW